MSAYTEFVKANYHKVKHLPAKQRFVELGKMWKQHSGGAGKAQGGGILSSALGAFGLGLDEKKKRGRKAHSKAHGGVMSGAGMDEQGAGLLSSALGAFGLGLDEKKKRGRKAKGGVMSGAGMDEHGGGFLSSALGAIGLGLDQKKLH